MVNTDKGQEGIANIIEARNKYKMLRTRKERSTFITKVARIFKYSRKHIIRQLGKSKKDLKGRRGAPRKLKERDVGEVRDAGGSREVDFMINRGSDRCYLQSAWSIPDAAKRAQETRPLRCIRDSFSKLVVVNDDYVSPHRDDDGIIFLSLRDFLLSPDSSPIPLPF